MGSSVFNIGLTGLNAAQLNLATTSHNIANADRPGYSRQENVLASRAALGLPYGVIGMGVDVVGIRRAKDEFLLANLRAQTASHAGASAADAANRRRRRPRSSDRRR